MQQQQQQRLQIKHKLNNIRSPLYTSSDLLRLRLDYFRKGTTKLYVLLDVPDFFFTASFLCAGLILSVSKSFVRVRLEEIAWEQRLEEGRRQRIQQQQEQQQQRGTNYEEGDDDDEELVNDLALTELDWRRQQAALEWSAYGKPRQEEAERRLRRQQRQQQQQQQEEEENAWGSQPRDRRRRRVIVEDDEDSWNNQSKRTAQSRTYSRGQRMTDDEIESFEIEYGIEYDPYYDDPYTVEQLPEGKCKVDKIYGDRMYENGEVFFKDKATGLYYRQGARPRDFNFWS